MSELYKNFHKNNDVKGFVSGKKSVETEGKKMAHPSLATKWTKYGIGIALMASTMLTSCIDWQERAEQRKIEEDGIKKALVSVTTNQKDSLELSFDRQVVKNFKKMTVRQAILQAEKDVLSKSDSLTNNDYYIKHYAKSLINEYNSHAAGGAAAGGVIGGSALGKDGDISTTGAIGGAIIGKAVGEENFKSEFIKKLQEKENKQSKTLVLDASMFQKHSR